jgi:hypothetical protein
MMDVSKLMNLCWLDCRCEAGVAKKCFCVKKVMTNEKTQFSVLHQSLF